LNQQQNQTLVQIFGLFSKEVTELFERKKRFTYASKLLSFLGIQKNIFLPSCIYPLHTLSNILKLDVDNNFYLLIKRMKNQYDFESKDLFNGIILNNDVSKCIYNDNFKNKTGFNFGDIIKGGNVGYKNIDENMSIEDLIKNTDLFLKEADDELNEINDEISNGSLNSKTKRKNKKQNDEKTNSLDNFWWFLNHPIPTETFYTKSKENEICLKCS
jgi:hypothetical protein